MNKRVFIQMRKSIEQISHIKSGKFIKMRALKLMKSADDSISRPAGSCEGEQWTLFLNFGNVSKQTKTM